jgi:uncharacterized protein
MSKLWRKHTTILLVVGVLVLIVATAVAFIVTTFQPRTEVRLGSTVFKVKIADTQASRERGLSGVTSLGPTDGMLFVFPRSDRWSIWMKDMNVPIDIIWLDGAQRVVHIVKNAAPELSTSRTFTPGKPARYILEVSAGATTQHSIKVGDTADFIVQGGAS